MPGCEDAVPYRLWLNCWLFQGLHYNIVTCSLINIQEHRRPACPYHMVQSDSGKRHFQCLLLFPEYHQNVPAHVHVCDTSRYGSWPVRCLLYPYTALSWFFPPLLYNLHLHLHQRSSKEDRGSGKDCPDTGSLICREPAICVSPIYERFPLQRSCPD